MNIQVNDTAEQFISKVVANFINSHGGAPQDLIAQTIIELYPNSDGAMIRAQLLENSVQKRIDEAKRRQVSDEKEFQKVGQLGLFGSAEHQLPAAMLGNSVDEVCEWMSERAEIEQQNAEHMQQATDAQKRKAMRFARWAAETSKVRAGVINSGWDPAELIYAEAINRAKAFQYSGEVEIKHSPERPVR